MGGSSVRIPWGLLIPWTLVVLTEVFSLPNDFVLTFAIQAVEAIFWLWAIVATARRFPAGWRRRATAAVLVLVAVWFTNWSLYHPASYFAIHRAQFNYLGNHHPVPADDAEQYGNGPRLPWWTSDLSTTGRGEAQGSEVLVLNQYFTILDGSVGYVHRKPGSSTEGVNMTGDPRDFEDCKPLPDDWFFC